jgi:hypothetical protein
LIGDLIEVFGAADRPNILETASDLRQALLEHDASGEYREDPKWSYTFGRKPL